MALSLFISMRSAGDPPAYYSRVKRLAMLAPVLLACAAPVWCATLERLSFEDMAAKSTLIVRGKVSETWTATTNSAIFTHYRIQVSETFKGAAGKSVEIMVPGGELNGRRQTFSGSPVLNKGGDFVLFLWTSRAGITWIMGLTQGLFAVPADGSSDPVANRPASPELMLDPNTARPVKDVALNMRLSDIRARIAAALAAKGGAQ
jgi:hypothetical protein